MVIMLNLNSMEQSQARRTKKVQTKEKPIENIVNSYTDQEKAKIRYELLRENLFYGQSKENMYANKFVEIEIQVASIVVGLVGASTLLGKIEKFINWFVAGSGFLILSLIFGIISIHFVQKFWLNQTRVTRQIFDVWKDYLMQGGNYAQAVADCGKIAGQASIVESPKWTYYFQTICLGVGLAILTGTIIALDVLKL